MDLELIKDKVEEVAKKIASDKALQAQFQKEPTKAVEKVLGIDLPDGIIEKVVEGVKAKLTADKLSDALGSLKKLF